jgi:hypothetical protein
MTFSHSLLIYSSVFSGDLTAEEVDGVGDKRSRDTTTVDVQILLEAVLTCP